MIEVNGLYKKYSKKVLAVKNLRFKVKKVAELGKC